MHSLLLLCVAALSICTLITSHPLQKQTMQTDSASEKLRDMKAKISRYGYFLMIKLSNRMRKAIYQESNGAVLLKKRSKDCLSLHGITNNNLLCVDTTKKPHISVGAVKDCFKTGQIKNSHHALCPWEKNAAVKDVDHSSESPPSLQNHLHKTSPRQRRNQHFDPSDPLGSENPRSRAVNLAVNYPRPIREHERSGNVNVSKESITSCDDPLHVLLSKIPSSPNLQKEKKTKQVAPSDPF